MAGKGFFDLIPPPHSAAGLSLADLMRYNSDPSYGAFGGGLGELSKALNDLLPPPKGSLANAFLLESLNNKPNGYGLNPTTPANPDAYFNALAGFGAFQTPAPATPPQWIAVADRFKTFNSNLVPTEAQLQDRRRQAAGVVECLNRAFYNHRSGTENSFIVGSWGKQTAIHPRSDLDLYFVLPNEVYHRFQAYSGNRQSSLLQHVKGFLAAKYPATEISGDRQVVVVEFERQKIEVVPAFALPAARRYLICDTTQGGRYKETAPWDQQLETNIADMANGKNVRPLARMLKAWRYNCNVPIKSFQLDLMAMDYLKQSRWRESGWLYYDFIIRDFFKFMPTCANKIAILAGTKEQVPVGDAWVTYAQTAYGRACNACDYEQKNMVVTAGTEWQKIFGSAVSLQ
jgi:hypothetical protein